MAKDGLPDPIMKREIVYGGKNWGLSPKECGRRLVEKGQYQDALLFFIRADAQDKIDELKKLAVEEGNAFTLEQIEKFADRETDLEAWEKLRENAEKLEKLQYAKRAAAVLGEDEDEDEDEADEDDDEDDDDDEEEKKDS